MEKSQIALEAVHAIGGGTVCMKKKKEKAIDNKTKTLQPCHALS